MNFFEPAKIIPTIIKIIITMMLAYIGIFFLRNISIINGQGINGVIIVITIIILFVPFIASYFIVWFFELIISIFQSQKAEFIGMPGSIPPVDLSFLFFSILFVLFIYIWICILPIIFREFINILKK